MQSLWLLKVTLNPIALVGLLFIDVPVWFRSNPFCPSLSGPLSNSLIDSFND
ncbi:hypothetical protein BD408DRAFT_232690 [Parasitella parasitica]|nr:hypothetical protein BD408DRAFT_232690 [Parasitella parasitica]